MSQTKTKIVATLGPASAQRDVFMQMVDAGVRVARINFSHGTHESNGALIAMVRDVAAARHIPIAVMADLQGPRVRTLVLAPTTVLSGMIVAIIGTTEDHLSAVHTEIPMIGFDQPSVVAALKPGHRIFIEDGLKQLTVTSVQDDGTVLATVIVGGEIKNHKGVNVPDTDVPLPALTEKDCADLAYALEVGVDYVALSFVRAAADVQDLRARIVSACSDAQRRPRIVVKIERPEAIAALDTIAAVTDGMMVARGDLATETGQERVGVLERMILHACLGARIPVIVATQMLASMEQSPRPTRAEINDVTTAVTEHADATMLSGESANGVYPVESVATMQAIIAATEASPFDDVKKPISTIPQKWERIRAIIDHADAMGVAAIVVPTENGDEAIAIAAERPQQRIIALSPYQETCQRLALVWGVEAYYDSEALTYTPHMAVHAGQRHARVTTATLAVWSHDIDMQ